MLKARRWWLGIILIVIVAAAFRFLNFKLGLPYYYDADEPWFFYQAAWQHGLVPYWLAPNPSQSLIGLYYVAQSISKALTHESPILHVVDIFTVMRFISVLLSLVTIVVIGLCGRELADEKAGWLAAAGWAIIPLVIYHSFIAIAEPWMMLCAAVALYGAARALRRRSVRSAFVSVCAGLLGFTFKYSMFPFAGIGLAASLWQLWQAWPQPAERRRWTRAVAFQIGAIIAFLIFMVLVGGLLSDISGGQREVATFFEEPLARFDDPGDLASILGVAFFQFGLAPLIFWLLYAGALGILVRKHTHLRDSFADWRVAGWVLFGALGSFAALLVPTYLDYEGTLGRYMFAATLIFLLLAACSFSVILDFLRARLTARSGQRVLLAAAAFVLIVWFAPLVVTSVNQAREFSQPYTLTDLMVWASNTLGEGGVVAEPLANRTFNREWGGYQGDKRLLSFRTPFMDKTPQEWQQEGYRYLEVVADDIPKIAATSDGAAYLAQLQELRRFPPPESSEAWAGAPFVVYQLHRFQTPSDLAFGDQIRLVGVDGLQTSIAPGDTLSLSFYWQAIQPPSDNFSLFVHLLPASSDDLVAQADGAPGPVNRPTLTWLLLSETLVSEPFTLTIPPDTPAGSYRLSIGIYQPYTGQRLATSQGNEALLATLDVTP
ncbi:MAG: hypothetical protein GC204_01210 [Chloroflexi bacterium]|nr:hypothetical protein [Chloroflexota bacterium]